MQHIHAQTPKWKVSKQCLSINLNLENHKGTPGIRYDEKTTSLIYHNLSHWLICPQVFSSLFSVTVDPIKLFVKSSQIYVFSYLKKYKIQINKSTRNQESASTLHLVLFQEFDLNCILFKMIINYNQQ
jgi:hypothetical protein